MNEVNKKAYKIWIEYEPINSLEIKMKQLQNYLKFEIVRPKNSLNFSKIVFF